LPPSIFYFPQNVIPLPENLIDIDTTRLREMEQSSAIDGNEENIHETIIDTIDEK
jgi:hypothetical protein